MKKARLRTYNSNKKLAKDRRRRTPKEAAKHRLNTSSNLTHHEFTLETSVYIGDGVGQRDHIVSNAHAKVARRADENEGRAEGAHTDTNSVDSNGCSDG